MIQIILTTPSRKADRADDSVHRRVLLLSLEICLLKTSRLRALQPYPSPRRLPREDCYTHPSCKNCTCPYRSTGSWAGRTSCPCSLQHGHQHVCSCPNDRNGRVGYNTSLGVHLRPILVSILVVEGLVVILHVVAPVGPGRGPVNGLPVVIAEARSLVRRSSGR